MHAIFYARWDFPDPPPEPVSYLPPALTGCRYRIEVFGKPRAPWRVTPTIAMQDAIDLDLASWDASTREHYLAVPVDMAMYDPASGKPLP